MGRHVTMLSKLLLLLILLRYSRAYQQASFYKNITLPDLDDRLVNMIKHPHKDKGDDLMDGSFWYYSQLEDMEKAYVSNVTGSLDVIRDYVRNGKPKFVTTPYNKTAFKTQFLWDKGDFLEFGVNVEGTSWIWNKFQVFLGYNKTSDFD